MPVMAFHVVAAVAVVVVVNVVVVVCCFNGPGLQQCPCRRSLEAPAVLRPTTTTTTVVEVMAT